MNIQNPYTFETQHWEKNLLVCGIDEVGRGCLAGPVVTAAAILHKDTRNPLLIDSKQLSQQNLVKIYKWLINHCTYSIAINSHDMIDTHNIYQATKRSMRQALLHLLSKTKKKPSLILIDAMPLSLDNTPYQEIPVVSFTQGESKSVSIAAASIIAKVTRDMIISRMHQSFPCYGLQQHKGYGTRQHQQALAKYQPSIIHRTSFLKKFETKDHHEQQSIFC